MESAAGDITSTKAEPVENSNEPLDATMKDKEEEEGEDEDEEDPETSVLAPIDY